MSSSSPQNIGGALFWLWIEIVLGCGVVYWLLASASPRFAPCPTASRSRTAFAAS